MPTPWKRNHLVSILLIWLGWSVLMVAYPMFAQARFELQRPDRAVNWSAEETRGDPHAGAAGRLDKLLAPHVAWDSEYYLSIARHGYDDPSMRAASPASTGDQPVAGLKGEHPSWIPVNAAFFPGYPIAVRILAWPLLQFGMASLTATTLAGVLVSLLGTLGAMLALRELARGDPSGGDGLRAAFYLLIWPASFFLAQVYTEGLFLGLSFGALAMLRRQRWAWAALLAAAATWTRATGALLLIPFVWTWVAVGGPRDLMAGLARRDLGRDLVRLTLVAAPAVAYLAWRLVYGQRFEFVETRYFGRGLLLFAQSWEGWTQAWASMWTDGPQAFAYNLIEFTGIAAGVIACLVLLRRDKALAIYGLAIIAVALTSGSPQGMHRYVLSVPALFLVPARWGRDLAFDRVWTLANTLTMAVFLIAFSSGFWAG